MPPKGRKRKGGGGAAPARKSPRGRGALKVRLPVPATPPPPSPSPTPPPPEPEAPPPAYEPTPPNPAPQQAPIVWGIEDLCPSASEGAGVSAQGGTESPSDWLPPLPYTKPPPAAATERFALGLKVGWRVVFNDGTEVPFHSIRDLTHGLQCRGLKVGNVEMMRAFARRRVKRCPVKASSFAPFASVAKIIKLGRVNKKTGLRGPSIDLLAQRHWLVADQTQRAAAEQQAAADPAQAHQ